MQISKQNNHSWCSSLTLCFLTKLLSSFQMTLCWAGRIQVLSWSAVAKAVTFCLRDGIFLSKKGKKLKLSLHFLLVMKTSSIYYTIWLTASSFQPCIFFRILIKSSLNFRTSFLVLYRRKFLQNQAILSSSSAERQPLLRSTVISSLALSGSWTKSSWLRKGRRMEVFLDFSTNSISSENTLFLKAETFSLVDWVYFRWPNWMPGSSLSRIVISYTQSSSYIFTIIYIQHLQSLYYYRRPSTQIKQYKQSFPFFAFPILFEALVMAQSFNFRKVFH